MEIAARLWRPAGKQMAVITQPLQAEEQTNPTPTQSLPLISISANVLVSFLRSSLESS